ncbi:ankyrin repeat domain-containing protein [Moraxella sp. ZY200743]|uniref:ankyrin repeat domain-containing protein n=1 Tax=Moraxella sp. ZY200743 TaxID=2911970 RepID=UPI003D7E495E
MSDAVEFEFYCVLVNGDVETAQYLIDEYDLDCLKVSEIERWNWLHELLMGTNPNDEPAPIQSIKFLIEKGIPINAQDIYGMTPLHYALRSQNADAAIALLEAGADPNIANIDGLRPLSMAGYTKDRLDVLKLMLDKGANVHHLMGDGSGRTILESRAPYKYTEDWVIEQWEIDFYEMMKQYA